MDLPSNIVRVTGPATPLVALPLDGVTGHPSFLEFVKAQARLPTKLNASGEDGLFVEDDAILTSYTNTAYDKVEELTGLVLLNSSFNLMYRSRVALNRHILLTRLPASAITQVSYYDPDDIAVIWASTNYLLQPSTANWQVEEQVVTFLQPLPCLSRHIKWAVIVSITAGCGTTCPALPDGAKLAIAQLAAYWYKNRESFGSLPPETDVWWTVIDLLQKGDRY